MDDRDRIIDDLARALKDADRRIELAMTQRRRGRFRTLQSTQRAIFRVLWNHDCEPGVEIPSRP